jgi:SSS family solute:Na+ symporter
MAGLLSMIVGCLSFAYFKLNPITMSESLGTLEPLLVALPLSFIFWWIGNQIGPDTGSDKFIKG